jgi:hypothetical protein
MIDNLNDLANLLLSCRVDTAAVESAGVNCVAVYEVLAQRGLKLVDAPQMNAGRAARAAYTTASGCSGS